MLLITLCFAGCQRAAGPMDHALVLDTLYQRHEQWQGTPYLLGGQNKEGIDCSGFVALTFAEEFDIRLPRSTRKQAKLEDKIPQELLQAGDLVFFKIPQQKKYDHVGIYLEAGQFLHASNSQGVVISDLADDYWRTHYWQAVRVLP